MARGELNVSKLDFDTYKIQLKNYLRNQSKFRDFDFEGSGLALLIDVLAYNTFNNAFHLNMVGSEMFNDSASLRESVVSRAKEMNYLPRSRRASRVAGTLAVTVTGTPPALISVPKYTAFTTTVDGITYDYQTLETCTLRGSSNVFTANMELFEGTRLTHQWTVNAANTDQQFVIPNSGLDTSTMTVEVQRSATQTQKEVYRYSSGLTNLVANSKVYFLEEVAGGKYQISFGDGVVGQSLSNGNIVITNYLVPSGGLSNGADTFSVKSTVAGYSTATFTPSIDSYGGRERESVDSVRFNAPKAFAAQGRAITPQDYSIILTEQVTSAESVVCWGGEDNDPPVYGKVYISIKPIDGEVISTTEKSRILREILKPVRVGGITPEFVDPDFIYLIVTSLVKYDPRLTTLSAESIRSIASDTIQSHANSTIGVFGSYFRLSPLTRAIDEADDSIKGNLTRVVMQKRVTPTLNVQVNYTIDFSNSIYHPQSDFKNSITSSKFTYAGTENCELDDMNGLMRIVVRDNQGNISAVVNQNIGTVNYTTGRIVLNNFAPTSVNRSDGDIRINAKSEFDDLVPKRNQILDIDTDQIIVKVVDDTTITNVSNNVIITSTGETITNNIFGTRATY